MVNYIIFTPISLLFFVLITPLFFARKKIFFFKNLKTTQTSFVFINFFIKVSIIFCIFILIYLYTVLCVPSFSYKLTNISFLHSYLNLYTFLVLLLLVLTTNYLLKLNSWELILSYLFLFICLGLFFNITNIYLYFFLLEFYANLVFLVVFIEFNKGNSLFNFFNKVHYIYYQLILNSFVSLTLIILVCLGNSISLNYYNIILLIVLSFKVGLGPIFSFKWYIFKNLNILTVIILSIVYLYLFFFIYTIIFNNQFLVLTDLISIIILILSGFFFLKNYFFKIVFLSNFLQYSSYVNYNMFLLILFVDEYLYI